MLIDQPYQPTLKYESTFSSLKTKNQDKFWDDHKKKKKKNLLGYIMIQFISTLKLCNQ